MKRDVSYTYTLLGIGLVMLIGMFIVGSRQASERTDTMMYAPGELVESRAQGDWNARYWQWFLSLPAGTNPGYDVTGSSCAFGQSGPVFFLPPNFAPCSVPAGTSLLVPIVGAECSTTEPAPFSGSSEDELRACAAAEIERFTHIEVRIDGEIVPNIQAYRISSPLFTVVLPEDNVLGAPAGITYVAADGFQVIAKPLAPGRARDRGPSRTDRRHGASR